MGRSGEFEVIRDPLWNNIRIDAEALALLDSEPLQRLRYVRQLGHAFLVYPGATHTRFEHALGTYHLTRRVLGLLAERGELDGIAPDEITLIRLAALLHDVGHYPFSHALEEAGLPSHETLAAVHLHHETLHPILSETGIENIRSRLERLITGGSASPLQGLISGSLDLDKIDYLTRDARMCGVPYGTVDVDRLLHSITLVPDDDTERTVAVHEKGVSALESLLFARYQMYRNVYWHHAVRSATAMFKRLVRQSIRSGHLDAHWIAQSTDEALMEALRAVPDNDLGNRLRLRHLYKRAVDVPASEIPSGAGVWIADDPDITEAVEDRLAQECDLRVGELLLDFPVKPRMLEVDLPVRTRDGRTERLDVDHTQRIGLQQVRTELHTGARRFRVFTARPVHLDVAAVLSVVERSASELRSGLSGGGSLLTVKS